MGNAELIGEPTAPKHSPLPKIEQSAVLPLRPDAYSRGYQLSRVTVNEADWAAFRGALAIYQGDEQRPSKGEPMQIREKVA